MSLPSTTGAATVAQVDAARSALDAWVRDMVAWHFNPDTGAPFWIDYAAKLGWDPAAGDSEFLGPQTVGAVRGRVAARRSGAALGAARAGRKASLRLRNGRDHRRSQDADRLRGFPHRLRAVQHDAARRVLSEGLQLADARAVGPAAPSTGRRAPCAVSRRHLLLRRPGPALGHQVDQEGLDGASPGLQGSRDRPGDHDPPGEPRHPLPVHDAEAARSARAAARVDGHDDSQGRASRASSPAAPSSRPSGTASRTRNCSTAPT